MKDICLIAIKVRRSNGAFYTLPTIKGEPGINGKSAYQVAVDNGFVGTEEEWLESLKQGPEGATGNYNQFIYYRTTDSAPPATPTSENSDDYLPTSWTKMPMGVTSTYKYEWVVLRIKKDDTWGTYSAPALWAIYGFGDTLPEIGIDDVTGLEEVLNEFADAENKFIPKSYLFDSTHTKVATLNAVNLLPSTIFPKATAENLGAVKIGSTLKIDSSTGVLDTNIGFRGLSDSGLVAAPVDGSAIVWDSTLGKYINMETPIDELYHPLYGKNTLDFLAKTLRSVTLIIPKTAGTPGNNEIALHALENGYSIEEPTADLGAKWLTDLLDVELTSPTNDDGLFMVNGNFVNKPAFTKEQVQNLFTGLATTYHPYGGSDYINFRAKELRSKTLFIPTEITPAIPVGVALSAIENGYSIVNPEDNIVEFSDLQDIISLLWVNGQTIIYRNGVFVNESIYNKAEIDSIIGNLNMSDYLKKVDALAKYHPKFGLDNGVPLDFTADRLKSNTLIIPKGVPDLEPNEIGLHALENGYSIEEPGTPGVTNLSALEDVSLTTPLANNEILAYSLTSQRWINVLLSFNMFSDELSANSILVNDNRRFVTAAQIADWNSRWIYDEDTIKAVKVNAAVDSDKLGGIVAADYWHVNNSNLYSVDWKAKVLRSKTLVIPKELPVDLALNEVAIYALENGYSIAEPGGGSSVQVLDDLNDVINTNPQNNNILRYNTLQSAYVNGPLLFSMIEGTLDPTAIATSSIYRFVTDAQILAWNAKESLANKNQPDGYLGLNADAKIDFIYFPDAILGQVKYGGTIAANGIITSPFIELNGLSINVLVAADYTGYFFIPQADGTFAGIEAKTGDWIISNGAAGWSKVDNTDTVTSVNGRIGAIILSKSDVGLSNVDNTADANKNVLSATKLFTARTLWGQSFDGTGNVSGSLSDVDNLTGSGILNMGTILIPKTINPNIPLNTVSISALDNGYSIAEPEAGSVGSLDDLLDVDLVARVDKQLLHYSTLLGKFTNDIIDFSYLQGQLGADRITQSADYRFVTDDQKILWNGKQDALNFVTVTEGKYLRDDNTFQTIETLTTEERSHLTSAYNHSTTFGNPHLTKVNELSDAVISGAVTGEVLMYNSSTAKWYNAKIDMADVTDLLSEMSFKQPLNANLTTIASLNSDGLLRRSGGMWGIDNNSYALVSSLSNYALVGQNFYIGTTQVAINRASGELNLSGIGNINAAGQVNLKTFGADVFGGAIEIRERGFVASSQSEWSYSPAITFHWGGLNVARLGLRADGILAVDNNPLLTTSNYSTYTDSRYYTETEIGNFFSGASAITGYNKSNWDTAYSYSQIGHLPLAGGTITHSPTYAVTFKSTNGEYSVLNFKFGDTSKADIGYLNQSGRAGTYMYNAASNRALVVNDDGKLYLGTALNFSQYEVMHTGNIGSQSVNYAASAGNADTLDSYHASYFEPADSSLFKIRNSLSTFDATTNMGTHASFGASNAPSDNYGTLLNFDSYYKVQMYSAYNGSQLHFRTYIPGSGWQGWRKIWTDLNLTSTLSNGYLPYWNVSTGRLEDSAIFQKTDGSGNVGVSNSNPQRRLHINSSNSPALRLENINSNQGIEMLTQADKHSWLLGAQYNIDGGFEITPSTGVGGITFSTPVAVFKANGNVGIATSNPYKKFTISSDIQTYSIGEAEIFRIAATSQITGLRSELGFAQYSNAYYPSVVLGTILTSTAGYCNNDFYIATRESTSDIAPTERFRIKANGNVGVGIATPRLQIEASSPYDAGWHTRIGASNSNANRISFLGLYGDKAGVFAHNYGFNAWTDLYINNVAGDGMVAWDNKNVTIGYTSEPGYKFAVNGSGYFNGNLSNLGHFSVKGVGNYIWFDSLGVDGSIYMGTVNNYNFRILNNNGTGSRLELNKDGYVDIIGELFLTAENQWRYFGNPAPSGGIKMGAGNGSGTWYDALEFTVGGNWVKSHLPFIANSTIYASGSIQSATSIKIGSSWEAIPNGTSGALEFNNSGTKASLSTTGGFTASAFYHFSDMTLKDVVRPLDSTLDSLRKMSTFYYTLKDDVNKRIQLGMSAQQFEEYFPNLVSRDSNNKLQLEYPRITVLAIKAIQELDKMQQTQEDEIKQLKIRVRELELKLHGSSNY